MDSNVNATVHRCLIHKHEKDVQNVHLYSNICQTGQVGTHTSANVKLERDDMLGALYKNCTQFPALPFQTHWRRKAAEQRELSAEHYRACWELLSIAGWDRLAGVDGKTVGRHRGNCVRDGYWSLMHLEKWQKAFRLLVKAIVLYFYMQCFYMGRRGSLWGAQLDKFP